MGGRPVVDFAHTPVLLTQTLDALAPRPGGRYLDLTLGGANHARATLDRSAPDGCLLGLDRDPDAIAAATVALAPYGDRARVERARFSEVLEVLQRTGFGRQRDGRFAFDGVLFDIGISSHQIDTGGRGFSLQHDGPLDMRMSQQGPTASDLIESLSVEELTRLLGDLGEVETPRRYALAIKTDHSAGLVRTTRQLAELCARVAGPRWSRRHHPATLVFQALRIAVNDELGELERLLDVVPDLLADGGTAVAITFHSLEDRIVKRRFAALCAPPQTPRGVPVRADQLRPPFVLVARGEPAGDDELAVNPRARSARIRAIRRNSGLAHA